jgi:pimeloyl-ACP methyl ester carboxylesterase
LRTLGAALYPDTWPERVAVPLAFGPATQKMTWASIRRLVASDAGLTIMMKSLTRLPGDQWWSQMSQTARIAARATFNAMESGYGFINDVRQASRGLSAYRAHIQKLVAAPTLVTASRYDGGVSFRHARNFAETIEHARLYETTAPTHFYWIGGAQADITSAVESFLA